MAGSIVVLFAVPWLDTSKVRSARFRPIFKQFFWLFVIDAVVLGIVGANPPEGGWIIVGRLATTYYFLHFLVILAGRGVAGKSQTLAGFDRHGRARRRRSQGGSGGSGMSVRRLGAQRLFLATVSLALAVAAGPALAAEAEAPEKQDWSFNGVLGAFDDGGAPARV